MSIDGTYDLEINTPIGTRTATLILQTDSNYLGGTLSDEQGENKFTNGTVSGKEFSFTVQVNTPMGNINLKFNGSVSDDSISGEMQTDQFGSFTFKGAQLDTNIE